MRVPSLLLMFALFLPAMAEATPGKNADGTDTHFSGDDLARFHRAGFTYCDARIVAQTWSLGEDFIQAKTLIGQKIAYSGPLFAQEAVNQMRPAAITSGLSCNIHDEGLGYDDAARLAQTWGMEVAEAKATLERKLLNGYAGPYIPSIYPDEPVNEPHEDHTADHMQRFFSSHFRYCDAQLLARSWGISAADAKASIGYKISANMDVGPYLDRAREQGPMECAFHENFSFEEAQRFAAAWSVPLEQAKSMPQGKLSRGNHEALVFALGSSH